MSVFLRWGVFGILGVAALLYAYNASKRIAENHAQKAPAAAVSVDAPPAGATSTSAPTPAAEAPPPVSTAAQSTTPPPPAYCETELVIAKHAIDARKSGEPLDRLLRMQEIAFEDWQPRRTRFETVATRYYNYEGDFIPEALRIAVISDCVMHAPNPNAIPAP